MISSSAFRQSNRISIYLSTKIEVDTMLILKEIFHQKKQVGFEYKLLTLFHYNFDVFLLRLRCSFRTIPETTCRCCDWMTWTTMNGFQSPNGTLNNRYARISGKTQLKQVHNVNNLSFLVQTRLMNNSNLYSRWSRPNHCARSSIQPEWLANGTWNGLLRSIL